MKYIMLIMAVALAGCTPSAKTVDFEVLPDGLKDCKFYRLSNSEGSNVTVARCPLSQTTVRLSDKAGTTSVVIDGQEYVKK